MDDIPDEIWPLVIFRHLSNQDFIQIVSCNKHINKIVCEYFTLLKLHVKQIQDDFFKMQQKKRIQALEFTISDDKFMPSSLDAHIESILDLYPSCYALVEFHKASTVKYTDFLMYDMKVIDPFVFMYGSFTRDDLVHIDVIVIIENGTDFEEDFEKVTTHMKHSSKVVWYSQPYFKSLLQSRCHYHFSDDSRPDMILKHYMGLLPRPI